MPPKKLRLQPRRENIPGIPATVPVATISCEGLATILFPNSREAAAKKLQQAMFTGRKNGFGSNLVAKPEKRGKKKPKPEDEL